MQIQSGKLYENKSWKYLLPSLKYYGPELHAYLSTFFKVAVGVKDKNVDTGDSLNLFILIDTNIPMLNDRDVQDYKSKFEKFLNWVKYQPYYTTDYIYSGHLHMVVIQLPAKHKGTYWEFVEGKYSQMYTELEKNEYFRFINIANKEKEREANDRISHTRAVLSKNAKHLPVFVDKINKLYNTQLTVEELSHIELDFPPVLKEEIFNYE